MVDNVSITPGTGATVATDDVGGVQYQRVKSTWGVDGSAVDTSATNPLPVNMMASSSNAASVAGSITAVQAQATGTVSTAGQIVADVSTMGNVTFHLVASAFVGTVQFEASLDPAGTSTTWGAWRSTPEDGNSAGPLSSLAISTAVQFIRQFTAPLPGTKLFKVRCSAFTSGTLAVLMQPGPILFETSPALSASSAVIGAVNLAPTTNTPAKSNATVSGSSFTVLAANAARRMATFFNDGAATVYLDLSGGTASTTSYSVQIPPQGYYELPQPAVTNLVTGIGSSATGTVRVTELT